MNAVLFFRVSLQENVDMIKLQRLVKEKSARISELDEKFKALEEVTIAFYMYIKVAISRSSQCSTTGVTKAVVCAILSVGWCI